jgi:hypothetical protein
MGGDGAKLTHGGHASKRVVFRSEMTLNYWMMMERYSNLKEEVDGSIPGCEISSLLDKKNLPSGQLPTLLCH